MKKSRSSNQKLRDIPFSPKKNSQLADIELDIAMDELIAKLDLADNTILESNYIHNNNM